MHPLPPKKSALPTYAPFYATAGRATHGDHPYDYLYANQLNMQNGGRSRIV